MNTVDIRKKIPSFTFTGIKTNIRKEILSIIFTGIMTNIRKKIPSITFTGIKTNIRKEILVGNRSTPNDNERRGDELGVMSQ